VSDTSSALTSADVVSKRGVQERKRPSLVVIRCEQIGSKLSPVALD
jgi:hypothetical protein